MVRRVDGLLSGVSRIGVCAALSLTLLVSAAAAGEVKTFNIPAQEAVTAIRVFGTQSGLQVLATVDDLKGKRVNAVSGKIDSHEALRLMLAGTGLTYRETDPNTVLIERPRAAMAPKLLQDSASSPPAAQAETRPQETAEAPKEASGEKVEKVTVTGSRIRGAKQAAPVVTITKDDMKAQGSTDLGQVVRSLPQSFAGGQNPGISSGGGAQNQNLTGSSSINLRGLGQDATLTLLNGARLPYDGFTQATDVASIPMAAVDRIEVLLDGASAIYGSDAVGGVANIILKRDYDGVEFSARWGEASDGGFEQQQYTAVGGTVWSTGGFIATADFNRNSGVKAGDRDYITLPDGHSVYAPSEQKGALFSGYQQLTESIELAVDAFYTNREGTEYQLLASTLFGVNFVVERDTTIWGVMPSLRVALPDDWTLRLSGAIGKNEADSVQETYLPNGTLLSRIIACFCNDAESVGADLEGPLFSLPGGDVRVVVGGGYRGNEFKQITYSSGRMTGGDDSSQFAYGELSLPLISGEQNIPLVNRLSLVGAVRYEDYESFGETTTPKVGAIWGVTSDFDLKATWGKSFKVPTLRQQYAQVLVDLFDANTMGGPYPVGSGVLFLQGGNKDLTPEEAETFTAGFIARPDFLPGFNLEMSWFDIDYTDRIAQPILPPITLGNPNYAALITFNPTVAQQNATFALAGVPVGTFNFGMPPPPLGPYDPARVVAIMDSRFVNTASQKVSGVDLLARYTFDLFGGSFTANVNGTWLEIEQKLTPTSPVHPVSGIIFTPAEFRGRVGGAWSSDGWLISATVNHTGGVKNNIIPPFAEGDGWTTVDLVVDYTFETGPLGGELELTLGVQNLLNEEPPLLSPLLNAYANYDSTNYSALGRVVNVTLTQRF